MDIGPITGCMGVTSGLCRTWGYRSYIVLTKWQHRKSVKAWKAMMDSGWDPREGIFLNL